VSWFCDKSRVWRLGHSVRIPHTVEKLMSFIAEPRSNACCKSFVRIHESTRRMIFVDDLMASVMLSSEASDVAFFFDLLVGA
jgi:hypothetical protein